MMNTNRRFSSVVSDDTPTQKQSSQRNFMDEPVPNIKAPILTPTPFRRGLQSLRDAASKVANAAKRKWNDFYDWLIDYVPQPVRRVNSTIRDLKKHIEQLYRQSLVEREKAAKGYFKTFTIAGESNYDPLSYLRAVEKNVTNVIERNLNQGLKVK